MVQNDARTLAGLAGAPDAAQNAVFVQSAEISQHATRVQGPDFNFPIELDSLLQSYATTGFQASALSRAMSIIDKMVCLNRPLHDLPKYHCALSGAGGYQTSPKQQMMIMKSLSGKP